MSPIERLEYQYKGVREQPNLWKDASFFDYPQIELSFSTNIDLQSIDTSKHYRLGKLVEVFYQKNIESQDNCILLASNIQIQIDKHQTIGELDYIVNTTTGIKHIELTYKFYLYKTDEIYEIDRWVGPNLKDSLVKKLNKLKEKQFPLLNHPVSRETLINKKFDLKDIQQNVHFKAQLYVPLSLKNYTFPHINNDCIVGHYISYKEIDFLFPLALYHLPEKQDWLIHPKHHKDWISFIDVKPQILEQIDLKHSPLLWIKRAEVYERFFITFW